MTAQTETKTADQTADRLNDIQLADAVGGCSRTGGSASGGTQILYCGTVDECGEMEDDTGRITYRPCPRCGKPMHTAFYNVKWYCDPCNFSEYRPRKETWAGTEEELIAAAK